MTGDIRVEMDGIIYGLQPLGGISTYWSHLVRFMAEQAHVRLTVRMPKTRLGGDDRDRPAGMNHKADLVPTRVARYLPVVTNSSIFHSSYYRVPAGRAKTIVSVYDFTYERYRSGSARAVHSAQKALAVRRADAALCISERTRQDLLDRYPDVDPSRVFAIPLAADSTVFFPVHDDLDGGLRRSVIFVGQRGGYKRFDLAIAAVRACPTLTLAIVGGPLDVSERDALDRAIKGRWRMLGRVNNDQLRKIYASAFALIYPSDYEGFGLPLLEAMSSGAPVVTNRGSSLAEVGGQAALYASDQSGDAYAAALSALDDDETRLSHQRGGIEQSRRFTWEATGAATLEIYRRVI